MEDLKFHSGNWSKMDGKYGGYSWCPKCDTWKPVKRTENFQDEGDPCIYCLVKCLECGNIWKIMRD